MYSPKAQSYFSSCGGMNIVMKPAGIDIIQLSYLYTLYSRNGLYEA